MRNEKKLKNKSFSAGKKNLLVVKGLMIYTIFIFELSLDMRK